MSDGHVFTSAIHGQIAQLKARHEAVILAHNYQRPEIQDIADFNGDSLELSRQAAQVKARVIVFCGVHFMAETAAILNPDKTVLLPDAHAGCPMADMINAEQLRDLKRQHPQAKVICYVNSTAEVKAESDCCCTSANAVKIVQAYADAPEIIFVPDRHLGSFVEEKTGRKMVLWPGYCPTHVRISPEDIAGLKAQHPAALALAHPECPPPVRAVADEVLSTGQMCRFVTQSRATEFIIATEEGILHRLRKENPAKHFYQVSDRAVCPNMKKITLEKVLWSLQELRPTVKVEEPTRTRALRSIENMLRLG